MKELALNLFIKDFKNKDDILKYINYHLDYVSRKCEDQLVYSDFDDDHYFTLLIKNKK